MKKVKDKKMKKKKCMAKKICAVTVAAGMTMGTCLPVSAADNGYLKGTFTFGAHANANDLTDEYTYTDRFFSKSAYETSLHMAVISMQMASASISSSDVGYEEKSKNIQEFLNKLGFQNVEVNQAYKTKMERNTMGAAVAYKDLGDSVVLAIVPRSAGYEAEWSGNFNVGESGLHEGFKTGRDTVLDFAKSYVSSHASAFEGKTVKVWTAGYSRGAAVANLIGGALVDDSENYIGLDVAPENIYDYTFGTPLNVPESMNPKAEKYHNIHNYFSDYDPVTMVPFATWGFSRYGKDESLDVHNSATKEKMLKNLKTLNPAVYEIYTTSEDPDNFEAKTLGKNFSIVTDTSKTLTQKEFLTERLGYLTDTTTPTRESYAQIYQSGISEAVAILLGEDDDTVAEFVSGAGGSTAVKPLAVMLFAYNWAEQYVEGKGEDTPVSDDWQEDILPGPDTEINAGSDQDLNITKNFLGSDTYKEVYDEITSDDLGTKYETDLTTYGDLLKIYKKITGAYMSRVLKDGLTAIGFSGTELTEHPLIQGNNPEALSVVAAQALFGTKDSLSLKAVANKLNTAVTFVGNSSYMRVHNNEVILSWLRAMDNEPWDDEPGEQPLTYAITGADTWMKGSNDGLELKAGAGTITGIKMDGQETGKDQYTVAADGKSVTLSTSLLETLALGKHTVTVVFSDGEGSHEFQIVEAAKKGTTGDAEKTTPRADTKPTDKTNTTVKKGPKTGDEANIPLWGMLTVLSGAGLLLMAENKRKKKGN